MEEDKKNSSTINQTSFGETSLDQGYDTDNRRRDDDERIRRFGKFTRWWMLPFGTGLLVTGLGILWMYLGVRDGKLMPAFWLSWVPLIIGTALMAVSWKARASHWIHMRLKQSSKGNRQNINISLPLPFGLLKWVRRTFGNRFPKEVRGVNLDDVMDMMQDQVTAENPIYLWVDDEKEQQQVEIWIGRTTE